MKEGAKGTRGIGEEWSERSEDSTCISGGGKVDLTSQTAVCLFANLNTQKNMTGSIY